MSVISVTHCCVRLVVFQVVAARCCWITCHTWALFSLSLWLTKAPRELTMLWRKCMHMTWCVRILTTLWTLHRFLTEKTYARWLIQRSACVFCDFYGLHYCPTLVNSDWFYCLGFTFLVPAHPDSPGENLESRKMVIVVYGPIVCVCLTITFERSDLWPRYLVHWYILTLSRSTLMVKVIGQRL